MSKQICPATTTSGSLEPFDPFFSQHKKDDYCEGNAWQYMWLVPQDVEGLIQLHGGDEAFVTRLNELFAQKSGRSEKASIDMTGFIGQYVHGNEPSHHIAYLYAFAGQQWKTAALVREILNNFYTDQVDGICGNEDCGQMSAWYLLSAMGMYPVNPAAGIYVLGSPLMDETTLKLPDGKQFIIAAENNSPENKFIQSAQLNGQPYTKSYIRHQDILSGGKLVLVLGSKPNEQYGQAPEDRPRSVQYAD